VSKRSHDRPLIAISGRRWAGSTITGLPDNFADLGVDLHIGAYADSVDAAGGIPLLLPCSDAALHALDHVHGLVMTGGSDVDPRRYGAEPHPEVYGVDPERDRVEVALVEKALEIGLPVLAICRGMQVLNVALGGTLVQHLDPGVGDHHAAWNVGADSLVHEATFADDSLAASCYGGATSVNSLHHQALDRLGDGLVATGWSGDGTIESAESPGRPVLAVQWHPELVRGHPEPSFAWLIRKAVGTASERAQGVRPA
jgi:putative glutamine amidotransferase